MGQIVNSISGETVTGQPDGALEVRLLRTMIVTVIGAVIVSMVLAPWRVTLGLVLGGGLSLLNYHWLRTSVKAIFNIDYAAVRPRVRVSSYILRYLVTGIVVFAAYRLRLISLAATIAGLCSFVPALFVEAVRQFYLATIHREES
ncbi:MAG TPA: ATP synthase subunit I [Pyrinomonadaceae bacterium]|nr:ATP synthase subunit I [Pyrinomonadaceae bacterium]